MAFFPREERVRHQGKKMKIQAIETERLVPEKDWESRRTENAEAMEKADDALFNRILTNSDAPHRGKKTGSMFKRREEINLFLPYGTTPPPPPKPPNVHDYDEEYLRQFLHPGHQQYRLREEQKIIDAPSSFERNLSRNAVDAFYDPGKKHAEVQENWQAATKSGTLRHGLLDGLVRDGGGRHEGKRIDRTHVGLGVLTKDDNPIPGFVGVGLGNHEHLASIKPKAATPTPVYDPLGLNAQKAAAREKLAQQSKTPSHVFEAEYGAPPHIARRELPCFAKDLMSHAPGAASHVPVDPPRCVKHYTRSPPRDGRGPSASPGAAGDVIHGFQGLGLSCLDGGVPHQTGLKHIGPEYARSPAAPHRTLPLFQAHQEAYIR